MNRAIILAMLLAAAVLVIAAAPFVGMTDVPVHTLWDGTDALAAKILWRFRVPRVVVALLAGSALAARSGESPT